MLSVLSAHGERYIENQLQTQLGIIDTARVIVVAFLAFSFIYSSAVMGLTIVSRIVKDSPSYF